MFFYQQAINKTVIKKLFYRPKSSCTRTMSSSSEGWSGSVCSHISATSPCFFRPISRCRSPCCRRIWSPSLKVSTGNPFSERGLYAERRNYKLYWTRISAWLARFNLVLREWSKPRRKRNKEGKERRVHIGYSVASGLQ